MTKYVREIEEERDRLAAALEMAEREHQDCGLAVVALSRCVREAIDALPPALQRNSAGDEALARWVAVLRQWGIDPRSDDPPKLTEATVAEALRTATAGANELAAELKDGFALTAASAALRLR